ncbi:hypothetical protein CPB85DRAFT_956236 [Mucidula mucida]|nr:hypothetical protein CPB85DRAFT_956236 [Mucidula mucida]
MHGYPTHGWVWYNSKAHRSCPSREYYHPNYPHFSQCIIVFGFLPILDDRQIRDWFDSATFEAPFTTSLGPVASVYLVAPPGVFDILSVMKPFIDLAKSKGVKRFVLLSGGMAEPGGSLLSAQVTGKVHEYLLTLDVNYCVIRLSWVLGELLTDPRNGRTEEDNSLLILL